MNEYICGLDDSGKDVFILLVCVAFEFLLESCYSSTISNPPIS